MRLLSSTGALVKGRCGATNRCDYCARLAAVEIAERLSLDALEGGNAPTVWMVLTTRSANPDPSAFYEARRKLMLAIERRCAAVEWACVVEFTTGYGPRSGGRRRPHWNVLLKNVGNDDHTLALIEGAVRSVWCSRAEVNAEPQAQYVGAVEHQGGLTRYLALHFLKESQRPPDGWTGHRFTVSKHTRTRPGYFAQPAWRSRRRAQESLRFKRALWRALLDGYAPGDEADTIAQLEIMRAEQIRWQLVKVEDRVDVRTGEIAPRAFALDGGEPTVYRPARDERWRADAQRANEERDYDAYVLEQRTGRGRSSADGTRSVPTPDPLFTIRAASRFE
jgi:hypothetical protein